MKANTKIPYALGPDGDLVSAEKAGRGAVYCCPSCKRSVSLRKGEHRISHFAHMKNSDCSSESVIHKTAKRLIVEAVEEIARGGSVTLKLLCENCDAATARSIGRKSLTRAEEEVVIGDYRVDVVAFLDENPALCIEVRNTSEVTLEKAQGLGCYWIELDAYDVVNDSRLWRPVASALKPVLCESCKEEARETIGVLDKYGYPRGICSTFFRPCQSPYIVALEECWKCKERIPVFWWDGVPFAQDTPPEPRPRTIQYRYSKQYGGSYWMNTCPRCRGSQGDNFLFLFGGGVLNSEKLFLREGVQGYDSVTISSGRSVFNNFIRTMNNGL